MTAMMNSVRRSVLVILRVAAAGLCCVGIWYSCRLAYADYLFRLDNQNSIRSAIRLVPDRAEYYLRLSQLDSSHAQEYLTTALSLDRYNAQAYIELGLEYEANGDYASAEKMMLTAFDVDHTYLPRWSLANFYLRRDNMPSFWIWARRAAEMPADDVSALFELCWRASPNPNDITKAILNDKPELIRQYLGFLLEKDQMNAIATEAQHLVRFGNADADSPLLLDIVNRLIASNDAVSAEALWRLLIDRHWVVADATTPNNAEFSRKPLPVSFDWALPEYTGLHSWAGFSGLETEFAGTEPEDCTIAEQALVLTAGNYTAAYSYKTSNIPPETGVRWQIVDPRSHMILAESSDLSSDVLKYAALPFMVPSDTSLIRLRLQYKRAVGTTRISGTLVIPSIRIQGQH